MSHYSTGIPLFPPDAATDGARGGQHPHLVTAVQVRPAAQRLIVKVSELTAGEDFILDDPLIRLCCSVRGHKLKSKEKGKTKCPGCNASFTGPSEGVGLSESSSPAEGVAHLRSPGNHCLLPVVTRSALKRERWRLERPATGDSGGAEGSPRAAPGMIVGHGHWTDITKVEILEDSAGADPARLLVKLRDSPDQVLSFLAPALGVEEGCKLTRVAMQLIKGAKPADLKAGRKEK